MNSSGIVFFALFNVPEDDDSKPKEAAAVIKFSSSRMATQSECLGYEFAKWLGVQIPQARVIHSSSPEWLLVKEAAEKAREAAVSKGDEAGEVTCSELLEALELSRCLLLMNYVHASPLLEHGYAFASREAAEKIATALGRILMLDLVIRNEDRLPCRQLGWRGNFTNLLFADGASPENTVIFEDAYNSAIKGNRPRVVRVLQMDRRATLVAGRLNAHSAGLESQRSDLSDAMESPISSRKTGQQLSEQVNVGFNILAIDSGVPRRPPAGKRANDQVNYPKLVELLLNSSTYASNLLHEITGGSLGSPEGDKTDDPCSAERITIVQAFQSGFRAALRDLQGFHIFLLTLNQRLDAVLHSFMSIISRASSGDFDKEDILVPEWHLSAGVQCPSPPQPIKEHAANDNSSDFSDTEFPRTAPRQLSSGYWENSESSSSPSHETSQGKHSRWSMEPVRGSCLTAKLRDFYQYAMVP